MSPVVTAIASPPGFSRIRSIMWRDISIPSTQTPVATKGKAMRPVPTANSRASRWPASRARNATVIVVLGRLRYDPRTRRYADRRTTEGLSKPEIIRCLKRYVAREIYNLLATHAADDRPTTPPSMSRAA